MPHPNKHFGSALLLAGLVLTLSTVRAEEKHPETHVAGIDKAPARLGIGDRWPDVEVIDREGEQVKLRSFQDDPTVFVFYMGSECAGCLKQLIELGQKSDAFADQQAEVVAVSADGTAGVRKTLNQLKKAGVESVTILGDPELRAIQALGTQIPGESMSFHSVFLVDRKQTIRLVARGDMAPVNLPSPAVLLMELKKMNASDQADG